MPLYRSQREFFENEWFPKANVIGVSWSEFWTLNPRIIKTMIKGYGERIKQQDYMNWLSNQYTMSAVTVAVDKVLNGRKAMAEYVKEPVLHKVFNTRELNEEEKQREVDKFFARENARRVNWKRRKSKQEN